MKLLLKILIPVLILVGSVFAAKTIVDRRPEARTRPSFSSVPAVDAITLERSSYQVLIRSQGTVAPARESSLVPEVTGIVRGLSPRFLIGESFEAGEVLVEIDGRDYEIALAQAEARYAQASASLQEERARSAQAQADWKSLGRTGKPSSLTARVPQVAAARANLAAAKAEIEKAKLDLERTRIIASYDGRVMEKRVDEGEFVSRGVNLGRIYSISNAEIRLPVSNRQRRFLTLTETGTLDAEAAPVVRVSANIGGQEASWEGRIVRSEGVDTTTQQLNVIARLDNPFVATKDQPVLQTGQFVNAVIEAQTLENVFVIPRSALRENREVLLVDEQNQLQRVAVSVAWTDDEVAAVTDGLSDGQKLVITALGAVTDGSTVNATVDGVAPPPGQRSQRRSGQGQGAKPGSQNQATKPSANQSSSGANGDESREERMARLKAMVDSGEPLPEDVKRRLRQRLEAGAPLPPWLQEAIR